MIFTFGIEQQPDLLTILNLFRDRFYYGEGLELESVHENTAFGFTFIDKQNFLNVLAAPRRNRCQNVEIPRIQTMPLAIVNRGQAFGPRNLIKTEAVGACVRLLDMTNDSWEGVHLQIIRLLGEFLLQGLSRDVVITCMSELTKRAAVPLSPDLRNVLSLPTAEIEVLCVGFDNLLSQAGTEMSAAQEAFWARA